MTINEKNIINNVNATATKIELDKNIELDNGETLRLDVYYEKDPSMLKEARAVSSPVTLSTTSGKVTLSGTSISNFTSLNDGKLYFRLYKVTKVDGESVDTLLSETVVEKVAKPVPQLAEVTATRNSTNNVVFTGTRYGESDIQTIYYCAVPVGSTAGWNGTTKKFTYSDSSYTAETFKIAVNGADSVNKELPGLTRGKAYTLFYVLENEKGSQSALESVNVAADNSVRAENKVTNLKYDKSINKFTWTTAQNAEGYTVTLYDAQNNIYYVGNVASSTTPSYELNQAEAQRLGLRAGEYYLTVVTKGNNSATTVDSVAVKSSNTVKIGQIAPITNVKYEVDKETGKSKLTWTENDKNSAGEELTFKMDRDNKDGLTVDKSVAVNTVDTAYNSNKPVTSFELGVLANFGGKDAIWEYKDKSIPNSYQQNSNALNRVNSVSMVAKAKTTVTPDDEVAFYLDSEPTEFNFYIPYRDFVASSRKSTDKSVTLNLDVTPVSPDFYNDKWGLVYGSELEDYKYQVRVYTNGEYLKTVTPTTHYVDANENEKYDEGEKVDFTIDGLAANTEYTFILVTTCGEFEAWSKPSTAIRTMPKIQGLTKVGNQNQCFDDSETFYATQTQITVEENTYGDDETTYPSGQLNELCWFLNHLNNGDKVTISGNNIELELNSKTSYSTGILSGSYLKDKIVTLTGSDYEYSLATNSTDLPKEVHIKSGQFDITGLSVNEKEGVITLGNGSAVKAKAGQELTIEAGATATINGIKITTEKENVVRVPSLDTIEVVANNNTLTFENVSTKVNGKDIPKQLTIKFVSEDGNNAVQQGSITIINGEEAAAKIVVTQENVTVEGGLTVNVEKGEVDVSDVNITASKTVTLSKDAAITAIAETDAPEQLIGTTVTIKNYATVEELVAEFKDDASKGYEITPEVLAKINTWLATFGISGKGAKVTVGSENKVTIAYEGTETLTVQGLK